MDGSTRQAPLNDGNVAPGDAAMQRQWRNPLRLSSAADAAEQFLATAEFALGAWIPVGLIAGIALWFALPDAGAWISAVLACVVAGLSARLAWRDRDDRQLLLLAVSVAATMVATGILLVWVRSHMVGVAGIERPIVARLNGRVLERIEQPANARIRLVLATREPATARAIRVRLNLPEARDRPGLSEGALVALDARLMPPAPPPLPGAYDFARAAWFEGLAATGSVLGEVRVLEPGREDGAGAHWQRRLSAHVRSQLGGSPGAIAAAFASGDRGAIAKADEDAMRDAGLTHLLSISGLHVSAMIGAVYVLAIRLLALWPWLALRVRLPLLAAGLGAMAGIFYTILTGSEVPTVRSCIGALLVLFAVALGREPLSLRMLGAAAMLVLVLWPEALVSPGFQMSFASVLAIVALHDCAPVRTFLSPSEEWRPMRTAARRAAMLLATGIVIELALMPIGLFHFHRAGIYGALANVLAIPLVTFATMPLIALALFLDLAGQGAPAWWMAGKSLDLLLALAHAVARQPGAVQALPAMAPATFALFAGGGLWLALWPGRVRLLAMPVLALASLAAWSATPPDVLAMANGGQVAISTGQGELRMLRDTKSPFARDNLIELSGTDREPRPLGEWPAARCSLDFCSVQLRRSGRNWRILVAKSRSRIAEADLATACKVADIVIADRRLPRSCAPRWLKADRAYLAQHGGIAISLSDGEVRSVSQGAGEHGWWRNPRP